MPCACAVTHVQRGTTTFPSPASKGSRPYGATSPTAPSASPARCFYCLCTMCGRDLPDIPTVTCNACGSQTHITCARDVYSHEWLFVEVAGSSAVTLPRGTAGTFAQAMHVATPASTNTATAAATSAVASSSSPTRGNNGAVRLSLPTRGEWTSSSPTAASPGVSLSLAHSRDTSYVDQLPSPQAMSMAAAKIGKEYNYYCHPDCAMGMEVVRNPQFNAALSARVEAAFAMDWRRTWRMLTAQLDNDSVPKSWAEVEKLAAAVKSSTANTEHTCSGNGEIRKRARSSASKSGTAALPDVKSSGTNTKASILEQLSVATGGNTALAQELTRLYSQLRAEAWAAYFEQERHHSGHPLFYPPPFVDVQSETALNHVLEAAAPHGQAARLYLLDPDTHPVGSAVAIPVGVLARWQQPALAPLIKVNDSNNFVAEAAAAVACDTVVPETVTIYRNCSREGQVMMS